jgi:hypothetical protein
MMKTKSGRETWRGARKLQQTVLLQFLAQRIAVDAEILGGQRLIAAGLLEHHFEQEMTMS